MKSVVVLGAGPCGLGAAHHLYNLDHPTWQLFEKNLEVGGLSTSFLDDVGFTWDIGGHVLFSRFDYFDQAVGRLKGQTLMKLFQQFRY